MASERTSPTDGLSRRHTGGLFFTRLRPNLAQYYATGSKTLVLAVRMSQPNDDCWRQTIEKNCLQRGQILRPRLENSVGNASPGDGLSRGNMA